MMARGILEANLPASEISFLISSAGYTVGFIIVIIANQQLLPKTRLLPFYPLWIGLVPEIYGGLAGFGALF